MEKNVSKEIFKKTVNTIEKEFGKGSVFLLGDNKTNIDIDVFSSGSYALDRALGIGGFPCGKVIEIFGPESGGKTTLALHSIASIQKQGKRAMYIDAEHALDPSYAKKLGVDIENLLVAQPDSGEQAFEIIRYMVTENLVDLFVLDSVAALVTQAELTGEMDTYLLGAQARMMSNNLRRVNLLLSKNNSTIMFINQVREKIGVMYGNPETTPGGRALKFYSSIRVDVRQGAKIKQASNIIGQEIKFKVVKNKLTTPFKTAISEIIYGEGICPVNELINMALENNVLERRGIWYYFKKESISKGKDSLRLKMKNDAKLFKKIESEVFKKQETEKKIEKT